MHSVCRCSLPVWRRSFLKKGTPRDLFWRRPGSAPGGIWPKTTTLVRDHEYFIPTKFHQNPSSGSGEEVENVKSLRTDGRTDDDDGRTDDGRCAMTIAHLSLRLRWAKKGKDLTQSCDKNPYTHRKIQKATWQHKNATKNFDYTTIADRLRTVSWSNSSHPTGVVKPVYERSTFPLTATAV